MPPIVPEPFVRFKLSPHKCIQGIDLIASKVPNITQYYICKIFYFADKEHFLDWGRPISGDRFVAMQHGPVPSFIYDVLKSDSGYPDEILDTLSDRVKITNEDNKRCVTSLHKENFSALSPSDTSYLLEAVGKYAHMSFSDLKRLSHQDPAYEAAWAQPGLNNEMNVSLWLENPEEIKDELKEKSLFSASRAFS